MHRWDAENALGSAAPMDVALAADGVAEVFDTMTPRMIARGAAKEPEQAVRITAADSGGSWTYGPGERIAEISGRAEDLLLMLWGRKPQDTDSVAWIGDREAGLRVLAGPLVPDRARGRIGPRGQERRAPRFRQTGRGRSPPTLLRQGWLSGCLSTRSGR